MTATTQSDFEVGGWTVRPALCRIISVNQQIDLQPRWMDVLVLLAHNAGQVVSTNDIIDNVWGNVDVAQDSVYFTVSNLRKALANDDSTPVYIETIAKRGYRLVAPVCFPEVATARRRRLTWYAAAAATAALAAAAVLQSWNAAPGAPRIPNSIAVMPFFDLLPVDGEDYSLGFVDKLLTELHRIEGLEVMARTSSYSLEARKATAQEIGRELGVETILEGSLKRDGNSVEVNAQLIRTDGGLHIWADTYRFDIGALARVRTDIARQVAEGLGLYLPPAYVKSLDPLDAHIVLKTRVNTFTDAQQERPRVRALADGGYLIAWRSMDQDGSFWGIYAHRFAETGEPIGREYRINESTREGQYLIEMELLPDGRIAATWQAWEIDGDHWGVAGRLLGADGIPAGAEFAVNDFADQEQMGPDIATLSTGHFVVSYTSKGQTGPGYEVFVRFFDAEGTPVGPSSQVNSFSTNNQTGSEIVAITDDTLLIIWQSMGVDGSAFGVAGRILDKNGGTVGPEFVVNDYAQNDQDFPDAERLLDGGAVVVWQSEGQDADGTGDWGIYGQLFSASGNKVGTEFQVNTFTEESQRLPQVTAMPDGGFFVAWMTDGQFASGMDVAGQRFDTQGVKIGAELLLNVVTTSYQRNPSPATLSDGSVIVAFHADDWDGSYFGVFRRRLVFSGIEQETMVAKDGGDTFVFEAPFSAISITNFDPTVDRIDLSALGTNYDSLTLLANGSGLIVDTGDGLIRIPAITELQAGHFLF